MGSAPGKPKRTTSPLAGLPDPVPFGTAPPSAQKACGPEGKVQGVPEAKGSPAPGGGGQPGRGNPRSSCRCAHSPVTWPPGGPFPHPRHTWDLVCKLTPGFCPPDPCLTPGWDMGKRCPAARTLRWGHQAAVSLPFVSVKLKRSPKYRQQGNLIKPQNPSQDCVRVR